VPRRVRAPDCDTFVQWRCAFLFDVLINMARLLSVNVGMPRDIQWRGQTIHTGIFKESVPGRRRVGRLNIQGDGQGDKAGHGGVNRAVFVYQIESYRYWQQQLGRNDFVHGQFGENFTVEGMPDDEVCIGDRFRIGSALFEVAQPRVTCYRIGIRMDEPRMPALLTSSGRPGFYFRVLEEGEVGAGDTIVKVGAAQDRMSVTEVNALLYLPGHTPERLQRAMQLEALSPGWRSSLEALLQNPAGGNAGLRPEAASHPASPGFRALTATAIEHESSDVLSVTLASGDGEPLAAPLPGQYVVIRLRPIAGGPALFRSYSLSGPVSTQCYRISVKVEPQGRAGAFLQEHLRKGDAVDVSTPHGSFILAPGAGPVVLLSAGIGATPVLAMLHALAASHAERSVLWLQATRDGAHHPFAAEINRLLAALPRARRYVSYSQPRPQDAVGVNFDAVGHLSRPVFEALGLAQDADYYLCGPARFMADMKETLAALGVTPARIHSEMFEGGPSLAPGVVAGPQRGPHALAQDAETGPLISFARSRVAAHWPERGYRSLLELAEACDVPVRWSCRSGVCHNCESGLISGCVVYSPEPLERPSEGNVLLCCAQPTRDLVLDL
jgi:MOSC domain-containing protein YiiM/ferredoxin-NADP reductase/ferredoxin